MESNEVGNMEGALSLLKTLDRTPDSELRVLIFTATYFVLDGVTMTIRRIETFLRPKGAKVKILTTVPDDVTPEQLADVIPVAGIKIPFTHAGNYAFGVGLDENALNLIEQYQPNLIHFTVPDFVALDGIRYCQKNNIAYMATWHSNYCDYLKYYYIEWVLGPAFHRYLRGFYEQIPAVYVPTPYMLRKMQHDWGYGTCTDLREWGRGCDLKLFSPDRRSERFRQSRGIGPDDVVILWVGRLVPEKRPDIWLNVVKRLQQEGLPVKAMVVGHGTFEATLSQIKNVVCCGWLSGVDLAEAYASSDILLFPSDVETFGNVTLEALACGCPSVVEEKCGGHLVMHGENGFACKAGVLEDFYKHTKSIAENSVLRRKMSVKAREGSFRFERSKIMQQMAENYKDAIERHRDPAFVKHYLQSSPEAAGQNFLSLICCNYWLVKTFAEPFLNTSKGVQQLADGATSCSNFISSHQSCSNLAASEVEDNPESMYDAEKKVRCNLRSYLSGLFSCSLALHYAAIFTSLFIVFVFVYASFTL